MTPERDAGTSPFTAIERVNRSEEVRRQLEEAIRGGLYAVGDRLPSERELGEMLRVSRVSVREALSALEALGLVDVQQGRGCFVTAPGYAGSVARWLRVHRAEIIELLAVRGALDELAAQEAAGNGGATDRRAIREATDAFAAAARDPEADVDTLERLDIAFHESLAGAGGNALLGKLLHDLNHHLSASRRAVLAVPGRRETAAAEHLQICEAILDGRGNRARALARAHVAAAQSVLEELAKEDEGRR